MLPLAIELTRTAALQKLHNLLEDIFEESDSLPANPSTDDMVSARYFNGVSNDGVQALLSVATMEKVIRYVTRLQASMKRQRARAGPYDGSWDVDSLTRLFRMLEKILVDAETLNPFPNNGSKTTVNANPSPRKKKSSKKDAGEDRDAEPTPEQAMTEDELDSAEQRLATMMTAASAALCVLAVLDCDTLPKHVGGLVFVPRLTLQLYSEDLLQVAVQTVRDQMAKVLFPVVEGLAGERGCISSTFRLTPQKCIPATSLSL